MRRNVNGFAHARFKLQQRLAGWLAGWLACLPFYILAVRYKFVCAGVPTDPHTRSGPRNLAADMEHLFFVFVRTSDRYTFFSTTPHLSNYFVIAYIFYCVLPHRRYGMYGLHTLATTRERH